MVSYLLVSNSRDNYGITFCGNRINLLWIIICVIIYRNSAAYSGQMGQKIQTELMVEIYSKGLVRAIGKVLLVKFS